MLWQKSSFVFFDSLVIIPVFNKLLWLNLFIKLSFIFDHYNKAWCNTWKVQITYQQRSFYHKIRDYHKIGNTKWTRTKNTQTDCWQRTAEDVGELAARRSRGLWGIPGETRTQKQRAATESRVPYKGGF